MKFETLILLSLCMGAGAARAAEQTLPFRLVVQHVERSTHEGPNVEGFSISANKSVVSRCTVF